MLPQLDPTAPPPATTATPAVQREEAALVKFSQTGDLWWKNAVLYCADVQTFADSDGDGRATCAA